ncbi:hypothetical protein H6G89_04720 [Oscillatoria sp. FACHB-1407]|uniref:WD40 domain-containing protein n=1 Tax=Oscillatoria sp. FACHB-1407 TaxID=2692847 RepID=UPI001689F1D4|nr:hypothetical protein [Oscillatoria sp. FACHB-1407]MBD2460341.1 hypothetical protein [Oscillatoria sp. FACHB-1407]
MNFNQALEAINAVIFAQANRFLSEAEIALLKGAWEDQTYDEIANISGYSTNYLQRDLGPKFWKLLSASFNRQLNKTNTRAILTHIIQQSQGTEELESREVGELTSRGVESREPGTSSPYDRSTPLLREQNPALSTPLVDWGEAIDVSSFYGRTQELDTLTQWIVQDRCRLIAILGMGGMGKSSLAAKVAQQLVEEGESRQVNLPPSPLYSPTTLPGSPTPYSPLPTPFTHLIWRSLRNAPPLETLLADLVPFLSNQQDTQPKPERLLHWLRTHRCLVVLDNVETILQAGDRAGHYQPDYENYSDLFRLLGETTHHSCVLLTSREKPAEVGILEGLEGWVRSLSLSGSPEAALALVESKGLIGTEVEKQQLCEFYNCSPLALKVVASSIQSLFDGEIAPFLSEETLVFNGIRRLLEQQFERLSYLEQTIMYWLAINREWTSIAELVEDIVPAVSRASVLESLESLTWRNLIEKRTGKYTQQPVVMEYVTDCLIQQFTTELLTVKLSFFNRYPLLKTTALDYIRESQSRLILYPLAERLQESFRTAEELKQHLKLILQAMRNNPASFFAYGVGNFINLCLHLQIDLTGYNFSNFKVRQAYLQNATLRRLSFAGAEFKQSIFTQPCSEIYTVAFSPDGTRLATGEADGNIRLWNVADGQLLLTLESYSNLIWSISFHPNGSQLASSSTDHIVRIWDIETGQCIRTFEGHTSLVWGVAWSPDGHSLASGSEDSTIRLWNVHTRACLITLQGHTDIVWAVTWSSDGQMLASASADKTIRLWDVKTGSTIRILQGHSQAVNAIHFSPDGQRLASCSEDKTVRLWDVRTGALLKTLHDFRGQVRDVQFSPDGHLLAGSGDDCMVRLWDAKTGQLVRSIQGHANSVTSVYFNRDSTVLASSSEDHTVKLWDVNTGQTLRTLRGPTDWIHSVQFNPDERLLASGGDDHCRGIWLWDVQSRQVLTTLTGHTLWVRSVCFSPDGKLLASGSSDQTLRLWDMQTKQTIRVLQGHTDWVRSVCFSPDGRLLASASQDLTVRLWDVETGQMIHICRGHKGWVCSVHFSPDGQMLVSSSDDRTLKLWDVRTGQLFMSLEEHRNWVRSAQFSPDGQMLASGSDDQTIKLWDVRTGKTLKTLEGHTNWIWSVAFSPDGRRLASGSTDRTVKLWDVKTGNEICTLRGHRSSVLAVAFSPDGQTVVSSSADETIRLWDVKSGECMCVLRGDRPYEGMNITGITGITEAQKATLKALGAVEEEA